MSRFLYQHKQAHRNSQKKEKEYPENLESSFKADIDLQNTVSECKREYFIWWTMQFLLTLLPLISLSLVLSPFFFEFFWFFFFFFLNTHFLLASFSFGKDRPAQETLKTITVPHSLHKNLAITVYFCSSRDLLSHPTQNKTHMHTWFLLSVLRCFKIPTFICCCFFLCSHLSHCFYTRAGQCKVKVK